MGCVWQCNRKPTSIQEVIMRSLPDTIHRDFNFAEAPSPLGVLLLYEDLTTGIRAKQLVDQLVEHVNLVVSFRLDLRRFDLLPVPDLRGADTDQSLNSDILVLAAHGYDDLPPGVWAWLERWLGRNPEQPRALVMSLDERARNSAIASQIQFFLQAGASRAGVEVFSHFGSNYYSELDSAIAGIRYRAETTTTILDETLHRSGPGTLRFWGIND
jgi:hypothetical protein